MSFKKTIISAMAISFISIPSFANYDDDLSGCAPHNDGLISVNKYNNVHDFLLNSKTGVDFYSKNDKDYVLVKTVIFFNNNPQNRIEDCFNQEGALINQKVIKNGRVVEEYFFE